MEAIIIGDIHGCKLTLYSLYHKLPKNIPIFHTGDIIDRGPDTKGVIQFLIDKNIQGVIGNHEYMLIKYLNKNKDEQGNNLFLYNGGKITLNSYRDNIMLKTHQEYINNLSLYLDLDDLFISHSAIKSYHDYITSEEFDLSCQFNTNDDNILWFRSYKNNIGKFKNKFHVFGHSPKKYNPEIKDYYANIDTGCVFKNKKFKKLTALIFPEKKIIQQENIDAY